jgi:signal transduction histidine kinase
MRSEADRPDHAPFRLDDRPSVLLVDDDPDVAHTISTILRQEHFEVAVAHSAEATLRTLEKRTFDVLLLELGVAGEEQRGLLDEVRRLAPTTRCIVLTGYASIESAVVALRHGAHDYLVKPCVIEDLKQTVRRAVEQRRLHLLASQREQQLKELNDRLEERVQARTAELMQANRRLAEANAAKDRFLATLSHELRTPLTPLRTGLDLLKSRLPGGEWRPILAAMDRNLIQQARLIDDLLDIARITAGKLSLEKRPLDLAMSLRTAVEMIEPRAARKNQTITMEVRDRFPPLLADPERLQQVVANLLDNAVKFSPPESGIHVTASLRAGQVCLEVVDAGPGIDPAFLPRIFEPFWQADSSSRRRHGGAGLGLAIAREIALLHDGDLRADNVNPGARFTFSFPLVAAEAPVEPAENVQQHGSLRVLLVDDSLDTIQVLSWLLTAKGFQVREVTSVPEAMEAVRAEPPQVIITDIGMPEQDGYDLLRLIRADQHLSHIPVVAATGYVGSREQEQMAEAGFAASLSKPFDVAELLATLERICPSCSSA